MSDAYITRRGSTGGLIENSIPKNAIPVEDIPKNCFVEELDYMELGYSPSDIMATYDGINYISISGRTLTFILGDENGNHTKGQTITLTSSQVAPSVLTNIWFINSNTILIVGDNEGHNGSHYWYICKVDFVSQTASITYTSPPFAGGNYPTDIFPSQGYRAKVEVINDSHFLILFGLSDYVYGSNYTLEASLYSVSVTGVPTKVKDFGNIYRKKPGWMQAFALGKVDENKDEGFGVYWIQAVYTTNQDSLKNVSTISYWLNVAVKIYYKDASYEILHENTNLTGSSHPSSVPPGLYQTSYSNNYPTIVFKGFLVYFYSSYSAYYINFGSNYVPKTSEPTILNFTNSIVDGGYGFKYPILKGGNPFILDEIWFYHVPYINSVSHYCFGKLKSDGNTLSYEFIKELKSSVTASFLYNAASFKDFDSLINIPSNSVFKVYSISEPLIQKAANNIIGVSNLSKLQKLELKPISVLKGE